MSFFSIRLHLLQEHLTYVLKCVFQNCGKIMAMPILRTKKLVLLQVSELRFDSRRKKCLLW
jgi:hypothetical protein